MYLSRYQQHYVHHYRVYFIKASVTKSLIKEDKMTENNTYTVDITRSLLKDGPKFLSHKLIVMREIAYLRPTIPALLFCVVYIVVGVFLLGISAYITFTSHKYDLAIFIGGFGIAITVFGFALIKPFLRRASFSKKTGFFNNHKDRNVKLNNIVSLQINNKVIQRKHALNYACFELNLLTAHGRRINILNHNDQHQLVQDAQLLAYFLKVEIIDCRKEIIL
jgi:hypothetical protein